MVDHRIVLGYVPVRRDMFPAAVAAATEKQIRSRVEEILSHQHDIQFLTSRTAAFSAPIGMWKKSSVISVKKTSMLCFFRIVISGRKNL